jgi:hypothetical protein
MNAITETWRQLIRRKLWPLALLLVAAIAAVPYFLAKDPAAPAATPTAHAAAADSSGGSIVTLADDSAPTSRRRVLGIAKDPFEPAPLPKRKKSAKKAAAKADATPAATPDAPSGGSSAPPSSAPPASPSPTPAAGTTVPKGSIKVNFGTVDADLASMTIGKLEPLPTDDDPVLVFEGLEGKTAVFSVPGLVAGQGDGTCDPDPSDCSTVKLHAGDTEFLTVTNADDNTQVQYQLELVKVYSKKTVVSTTGATPAGSDS